MKKLSKEQEQEEFIKQVLFFMGEPYKYEGLVGLYHKASVKEALRTALESLGEEEDRKHFYSPDHTEEMNCLICGKPNWLHDLQESKPKTWVR